MVREVPNLARLSAMPADEAAAFWTVRRLEEEWEHESHLFETWLGQSEANRTAWERTGRAWNVFEHAESDELLEAMRRHALDTDPARRFDWSKLAAAAALVLAVVTTFMFITGRNVAPGADQGKWIAQTPGYPRAPDVLAYANDGAGVTLIALPDGSQMALDSRTRVLAEFTPDRRSLRIISGRAFFDVRRDSRRPFTARASGMEVTALGTRFDVGIDSGGLRVVLIEGHVSVRRQGNDPAPILMRSGQQLVVRSGARPQLSPVRTGDAMGWAQSLINFDNQTLAEVANELNRHPGEELLVRDPRLAGLRITGSFRTGDPERFGHALEQIYPVRVVRSGDNQVELLPAR